MPDPVIPIPVSGGLSGLGQDAAGLNSLLGLLFGNKTTTNQNIGGSTTTEQNIVDPSVIADTVRGLMEGNGGLASILSGQAAAGGYGGNTAGLQINDLVARITGAVAKVTATNVKTNSGSTNSSTTGTDGKAKETAALAALAAALKGMSKGSSGGKDSGGKGGGGGAGGNKDSNPTDQSENKNSAENFAKDITDNAKEIETEPEGPQPSQEQVTENLLNDTPAPPDVQFDESTLPPEDNSDNGNSGDNNSGSGDNGDSGDTGDSGNSGDDSSDLGGENTGDYGGDGGDGGCFITTAVTASRNLPDDCAELEILRAYRDNWLKFHHPEGIKMYYESAPVLVEKINARADSKEFYNSLYSNYIIPAITLILLLDPVEAYNKYREMVVFVHKNA